MMDIIKIGGIDYKITEEDDKEIDGHFGTCFSKYGEIKLNKSLPDGIKLETLLHECLHIIFEIIGQDEISDNEKIIKPLSSTLFQVLKDNNELLEGLLNLASDRGRIYYAENSNRKV